MNHHDETAIRDQCRDLLARYAIAVDAAAMTALFTEDGELLRGEVALRGHKELPKIVQGRAPGTVMRHLLATQAITVAPDGASASAVTYYLLYAAAGDTPPLPMPAIPFSLGDWRSDLARTPQGWKIARQEIRRRFVRPDPA